MYFYIVMPNTFSPRNVLSNVKKRDLSALKNLGSKQVNAVGFTT